jgi:hypothetical protein
MRTNVVVAGIVVLVIGLILVGVSLNQAMDRMPYSTAEMTSSGKGYFQSNLIVVNGGNELILISNSTIYLVPSQDLTFLNSTDITTYALHPSFTEDDSSLFTGLNGTFYIISLGSMTPLVKYYVLNEEIGQIEMYGLALLGGVILILAGIVIAVIGLFLRKKVH